MDIFDTIQQGGNTVILVTHEEDIAKFANRVIRLRDGLIENDHINTTRIEATPAPTQQAEPMIQANDNDSLV
jgi:putative ABC transport system ATP-binding protein